MNRRSGNSPRKPSHARLDAEWLDLTLPAPGPRRGHLHPITRIQRELEELFVSLGFTVLDGPEVEDRISQLRRPEHSRPTTPRATAQDTFWLDGGNLLRTHTSPVQVRGMERLGPPLRMIAPGRVFRNESVDASHEHTFYQIEGMMIDRDVSVAHLIYFMKTMLTAIFKREVTVRLRPGFFPFVEPGFELDIQCLICGGSGCPVCKQSGWVEQLGCGLVHPNVLRMSGIDPEEWNGFAFGLGLTRLAMMRYGIDDIRHLQGGDLRFLEQFWATLKFSYNWIRELVEDLDPAPGPLEKLITMKTAECEGIEVAGELLDARLRRARGIRGADPRQP